MGFKFNPFTGNFDTVSDPGGSNTQLQYNQNGTFSASADLTWNNTLKRLGVSGLTTTTNLLVSGIATVGNNFTVNGGTLFVDAANNRIGINTLTPIQPLQVGAAGTNVFVVDASGDVGIGTTNPTTKLHVTGDINLDDGGSFVTTVQCVTPTANRTISFPDATGTLALISGSSAGQLLYNNAGALGGVSTMTFDGTSVTLAGRLINSYTSLASAPAKHFTGTWFTGGTATTTKPHFLIEPTGTTSTAWSTSGTGLGVNAASGFAGRLLDLQVNGTSRFIVTDQVCTISLPSVLNATFQLTFGGGSWFACDHNIQAIQIGRSTQFGAGVNLQLSSTSSLTWGNGNPGTIDLFLTRDTTNTLAQRNGTNAQTFRVYNTFTSATDFELGKAGWERSTSDATTNGFISGTTLTVDSGTGIAAGQIVTGTGVLAGTRIVSGSGTTWTVSQSQTVGTTGARVSMTFGTPTFRLGTEKGSGGGTARALELQTDGVTRVQISRDGIYRYAQVAPAAVNTTANLTIANIQGGIITTTTAAAVDMTLPTGAATEAGFAVNANNLTFEWSVINTGSNAATVLANTDHTLVGAGAVAAGTSGRFATRRTAANTYVTYRLS